MDLTTRVVRELLADALIPVVAPTKSKPKLSIPEVETKGEEASGEFELGEWVQEALGSLYLLHLSVYACSLCHPRACFSYRASFRAAPQEIMARWNMTRDLRTKCDLLCNLLY